MKVLVTGAAGFIGYHTIKALIARGDQVLGVDCINDYYDPELKHDRLADLKKAQRASNATYDFLEADIGDYKSVKNAFSDFKPDHVISLAAQAGVRYSIENPHAYLHSNLIGFTNILEACRHAEVKHLVYASTSSAYGANTDLPYKEEHGVDHPLQFYAATKRANELMAHSYSNLYKLPTTGLRFFTVYGPWGRPDMAFFSFTKNIIDGNQIKVFNYGNHTRDFTYVDDIVDGIIRVNDKVATGDETWKSDTPNPDTSFAPFNIFNIGNGKQVKLLDYINAIEEAVGKKANMEMLPMQPGDVHDTHADISKLTAAVGYQPKTDFKQGIKNFVDWYREYYNC